MCVKIPAVIALVFACCAFGCAQQSFDQATSVQQSSRQALSAIADDDQFGSFFITFLLSDGSPAVGIRTESSNLLEPTKEIMEGHIADEAGMISFRALVPQKVGFVVFPSHGDYYSVHDSFHVDLEGEGDSMTLTLSEKFTERYKETHGEEGGVSS